MSRGTRKGVGEKNLNGTLTSIWRRAPKITSQLNRGRTGEREILRSSSDRFAEERQKKFLVPLKVGKGRAWVVVFAKAARGPSPSHIDQFPPEPRLLLSVTEPFTLIAFCARILQYVQEECRW